MVGKHPYYAAGLTTDEIIAEAREFMEEELSPYMFPEYDSDSEVDCQRAHGYIGALIDRLESERVILRSDRENLHQRVRELRSTFNALMAKLASMLDEDHFAICEEILRKGGVEPPVDPGSDHARGCEGRNYTCTCGYDGARDALVERKAEPAGSTHEERIALAAALTWDVNNITPDEVSEIIARLAGEGFKLQRISASEKENA